MHCADRTPESPVDAAAEAVSQLTDAVDRAIDEITGVPTEAGRIEVLAQGGASVVAEPRGD
jgi:hypothetical protein